MDELRGRQATWRFDGEKVLIHYQTGWRANARLRAIARCEVPVSAIASVEFTPGIARKKGWQLWLRLRERADPFTAVGAMLAEAGQPFRLTGDAATELIAEYYADQLTLSVDATRELDTRARPEDCALALVPTPPLHVPTSEGAASFDGTTVRLVWSGDVSGRKAKAQWREFDLKDIRHVDWIPSDGWAEGYLRIVTHEDNPNPAAKPSKDLSCLISEEAKGENQLLLFAACVTAHIWSAAADSPDSGPGLGSGEASAQLTAAESFGPDAESQVVYDRIRELGRLHEEGLLTDDEFSAKKAELLARL